MSSEREVDAARLVAIRVLKDLLSAEDTKIRARMYDSMLPGAREVAAVGEDRTPVGAVTRSKPGKDKTAARVTDPERFAQWARVRSPGNVYVTTTVDPLFVKSLLARIDTDPDYETADENGEVVALPPGVEVVTSPGAASTLRVLPDDNAAEVIRAALATEELTWGDLLALPVGESA